MPKIVPAMIDGAIDAATLPGDIWQGKYSEELDPRYGLSNVSPELGGRILNLSTSVGAGAMPKLDPDKLPRLAQEIATKEADGFGIPLTSGQASGDLNQLRSEQALRQTDPSQPIMRTFDDRQTEAIGAATDGIGREIGGTADDLAGIVTAGLQEKARLAKEGADAFLEVAQDGKLKVRAAAVRALPSFVKQRLGGTVVNDTLTPAASAALREIEGANPGPGSRALSWKKLDNIRRKLAGLSGTGPEDMTATRGVKQAFDDWLSDAVDRQLFSGNEAALQALRAAGEESLQYLKINTGGDAAGATIARMERHNLLVNGIQGAVYGAGSATGDTLADRGWGALIGAGTSAGTGVLLDGVTGAVGQERTKIVEEMIGSAKRSGSFAKTLHEKVVNLLDDKTARGLFSDTEISQMERFVKDRGALGGLMQTLSGDGVWGAFAGAAPGVLATTIDPVAGSTAAWIGAVGGPPTVRTILDGGASTFGKELRASVASGSPPPPINPLDLRLLAPGLGNTEHVRKPIEIIVRGGRNSRTPPPP